MMGGCLIHRLANCYESFGWVWAALGSPLWADSFRNALAPAIGIFHPFDPRQFFVSLLELTRANVNTFDTLGNRTECFPWDRSCGVAECGGSDLSSIAAADEDGVVARLNIDA